MARGARAAAHANLRAALARLRGRAPVLCANALEITLADRVRVDLDDGRAMARRLLDRQTELDSDLMAEAVPMLSLELLPGWYEDWILFEGENWRQQRLHALEAAAEALAADERWGNAIAAAEAAVSGDPLRESARAALIQVHLREGNQSEALREFERYKRVLHEELGLIPTPRLRALMPGAGREDVTDVGRGRLVAMSVAGAQRARTYPLEAVTRQSRRRHGATEY